MLTNTTDVHGEYTAYLFQRGHSLHPYMNTIHSIHINKESKRAFIKKRGYNDIPPKLLRHLQWWLFRKHNILSMEVV